MDAKEFAEQIDKIHRRVVLLMQRARELPEQHRRVLDDAVAELDTFLEELQATEQEIREQHIQLEDSHRQTQAERLRYQNLFDFLPDAYLVTDADGSILEANRAAASLLDVARPSLIGQPFAQFVAAKHVPIFRRALKHARKSDRPQECTLQIRRLYGVAVEVFLRSSVIRDQAGALLGLGWLLHDITEHKQGAETLRLYAERLEILHAIDRAILAVHSPVEIAQAALNQLRQLVPCQRGGIVVIGPGSRQAVALVVDVNGEFQVETGIQLPSELLGIDEDEAQQDEDPATEPLIFHEPPPVVQALLADGVRAYMILPLISQGALVGALSLGAGKEHAFTAAHLDIAREVADSVAIAIQQARLHEQISAGRDRLRSLMRRLVETQETERRQLAHELHDQVGQSLTVLNIGLRIARDHLSAESATKIGARLDESVRLAEEMMERIRDVMAELRPAVLDDYGLAAALRWYARQYSERTGLDVVLRMDAATETLRLASNVETVLFRVAQEALTNVVKHAHVERATVALEADGHAIRLIVVDRGVGFDLAEPHQALEHHSLGLIGIRERVEAVGGRLRLESTPGQGTRIVAEVGR